MITPKGKLLFVAINGKEDTFQGKPTGKYSATIEFDEKDYEKVKDELQKVWESSKEYVDVKDEVDVMNPFLGIKKKKDKEGNLHYLLKAKVGRHKKNEDGSEGPERVIKIEDGLRQELPSDTDIPNGSLGRLAIYPRPFKMSSATYGLSLSLQKIQLVKAAEYGEEFPEDDEAMEDDGELPF